MNKKNIKILLVDDEPDILEFMSYNLSNEGYKVYTATNGQEAIEKAISKSPHMILLDVMMPKIDGFELLKKIREFSNIPVIMLTARGEVSSRIVGLELGADDYVPKPFDIGELVANNRKVKK
jgi:DNA-binding response OmpR family regulator